MVMTSQYIWQREIPSNSTPGKTYTVSLTEHGEWQCDCMAWTRRRLECSHIRQGQQVRQGELVKKPARANRENVKNNRVDASL